jgi:hypothetical protein
MKTEKVNEIQAAEAPVTNEKAKSAFFKSCRDELNDLSKQVSGLVKSGEFPNTNAALMANIYKNLAHQVFKTKRQWFELGFEIRQGEKAFLLWGKPITRNSDDKKFFPIKFVYSNAQVVRFEGGEE